MKKLTFTGILIVLLTLTLSTQTIAGGSAAYPNGAEDFMVGAAPPPGFYFVNYMYYYGAKDMMDNKGHKIGAFDKVKVYAEVPRFIWMTNKKILGADYGQHLFIAYVKTELDFKAPVGPQNKRSYSDSGLAYLIYSPMVLGYHMMEGRFHMAVSLADIYIPLGQDDGNLAAVGRNYWTFEPVVALTYLSGNWEFSAKLMYDISTKQHDYATVYGFNVDRIPGQEFHADYTIGYALGNAWRVGLTGYYYNQVTDDVIYLRNDIPAPVQTLLREDEGFKGRVVAAGPGLWYNYKNMFFSLKTQREFAATNKTEGMNVWFKFTYAF